MPRIRENGIRKGWVSQVALVVKNPLPSARDMGSISGSGKSPGGGHGNPLQYSCLENLRGQRSQAGYSPWDHKESDMTEATKETRMSTQEWARAREGGRWLEGGMKKRCRGECLGKG